MPGARIADVNACLRYAFRSLPDLNRLGWYRTTPTSYDNYQDMTSRRIFQVGGIVLGIIAAIAIILLVTGVFKHRALTLKGALITRDNDTHRELPIANAHISVSNRLLPGQSKSDLAELFGLTTGTDMKLGEAVTDSSGYFTIKLPTDVRRGRPITFQVDRADYQPLTQSDYVGDQLYVLRMEPSRRKSVTESRQPEVTIGNVLVRYSSKATTSANIGSAAKTFDVINKGNVPCRGQNPCSPDGKWKATQSSVTLDAGPGNEFQNVRASCIAGPCPFTRLEDTGFTRGGRIITVTARTWSETATFLVEAEVVHPMVSDIGRESHPFLLGRAFSFTIPSTAEGVTIQAELNGETIVFPLGPALILDWADCSAHVESEKSKVYRCELKPGYRFN